VLGFSELLKLCGVLNVGDAERVRELEEDEPRRRRKEISTH